MSSTVGQVVEKLQNGEGEESIETALAEDGVSSTSARFALEIGKAHLAGDIPEGQLTDLKWLLGES